MQGVIPQMLPFPDYTPKARAEILHTAIKTQMYFRDADNIMISVSGGSDSDCIIHFVCKYYPEYLNKIHFVFVDTGLEYRATKEHLNDLETAYGIQIERIRGQSVVYVCKEYGFPILSKFKAHFIDLYQRDKPSGEKIIFYDGVKSFHSMHFTEKQKALAIYLKSNGIKVSDRCCDYSKKKPVKQYTKQHNIDLNVTGERLAEGGQRSIRHKSCFEIHKGGDKKFMPLLFWSDGTKAEFKQKEGIKYSDCYEVYGMRRTGCCGCPFNLNIADDLTVMKEHEPQLYKACIKVFGKAYLLTDLFNARRKKCIPESLQADFKEVSL